MRELPRDHPSWGCEFDWLGIDRHGHVAVFSSAGYGPLPETVNERLADVDAALERADELPLSDRRATSRTPGTATAPSGTPAARRASTPTTGMSGRPVPPSVVIYGPDQRRPASESA